MFGAHQVLPLDVCLPLSAGDSKRVRIIQRRHPARGGAAVKHLVFVGRLVFGAWMLVNGANHFFLSFWPEPIGHEPLAVQLMAALVHSRLFDVAMAVQLVTGALILTGVFVPVALCVVMPISTCALYWSVILDHQALGAVFAIV